MTPTAKLASQALQKMQRWIRDAQLSPDAFISFCLTDSQATHLRQASVHRELQRFLFQHRFALIELPRDHGKSVQVCGRILWELGHQPGLRIKFVCATDAIAAERTRYLREQIQENLRLRLVFPKLRPATPWTAEAFTIQRPAHVIGPSVAAFGVGAGSTGTRADMLICDDIVDVRSLHSAADRHRVRTYFQENLLNLLEPEGRCWNLATPWHPDDLNAHLKKNRMFAWFQRAVGPNLEPVWPEKWPTELLEQRRAEIGEASFSRGYRLQALDEQSLLMPAAWVQFWEDEMVRHQYSRVVLAIDPAVSLKRTADASALVVVGRLQDRQECRVLQALAKRVSTPELIVLIDDLDQQWQPDVILFESNAAFLGIKDLLQHHARFGSRVLGVTQSRSKASRISALSVPVQNGALRLQGRGSGVHPSQRELFEEMTGYPMTAHDDLVDALAMATDHLFHQREPRLWVM